MSDDNFENRRWSSFEQKLVFRHRAAYNFIDKGRVLDVGCGDGLFLKMLKEKNLECQGVDFSDIAVKKCLENNIQASVANLADGHLEFGDKEFEYAVALDVLEHLYFPENLFKELGRVSKYVIISVPNFNSLVARIQVLFGKVPENNKPNKGHVFWFNYGIINQIVKRNNYSIERIEYNTFWEDKFIIGKIMKILKKMFPAIFALSFVLKIKTD